MVDYRVGRDALEESIRAALNDAGEPAEVGYAIDAIANGASSEMCTRFLRRGGRMAHVLPLGEGFDMPEETQATLLMVGDVHGQFGETTEARDFGHMMMTVFARGLETGWLQGHPYEIVPGGLAAVQGVLENLKAGKASAIKYVLRIDETDVEGL